MRFFLMRTFRKALRALCYLASLILYLPLCNRIVRATLPTRQLEVSIFYNNSFHFSFVLLLFSVGCSLSAQYREQSKKVRVLTFAVLCKSTPYRSATCTVGCVNLYKKFEIEKYTVCGKLILPQKMERHFLIFLGAQLACEFVWICEYLQASCIQHF